MVVDEALKKCQRLRGIAPFEVLLGNGEPGERVIRIQTVELK